jgi:RHS repeat-associated protein
MPIPSLVASRVLSRLGAFILVPLALLVMALPGAAQGESPMALQDVLRRDGLVLQSLSAQSPGEGVVLRALGRDEANGDIAAASVWQLQNFEEAAQSVVLEAVEGEGFWALTLRPRQQAWVRSPHVEGHARHRLRHRDAVLQELPAPTQAFVDTSPIADPPALERPPVFRSAPRRLLDAGHGLAYNPSAWSPDALDLAAVVTEQPDGLTAHRDPARFDWWPTDEQAGLHSLVFELEDERGLASRLDWTLRVVQDFCPIYPIALPLDAIQNLAAGERVQRLPRKTGAGGFAWLSWSGETSASTLAASLVEPGDSWRYRNPDDASDSRLDVGDHARSAPGSVNAAAVRENLERLLGQTIVVPVWDAMRGQGNNLAYRTARFATIRLSAYQLTGQGWLSFEYLGEYEGCYNDPPQVEDLQVETLRDTAVAIELRATDREGDALSFRILQPPQHGELGGQAPNLVYTPAPGYVGEDAFTYVANDGEFDSREATVSITVRTEGNGAPVAEAQSLETARDVSLLILLVGRDPDGDSLSFELLSQPSNGSLGGAPPDMLYTPSPGFVGDDGFAFRVFDGEFYSEPAVVALRVLATNRPPQAAAQRLSVQQDTALAMTLSGSDPDGDALDFEIVEGPNHGTLDGTAPELSYVPAQGFHGEDAFRFRVFDGALHSEPATVRIQVQRANRAPTAEAQSLITVQDSDLSIALSGSDPDGDPLAYEIVSAPLHGDLVGAAPNLVYVPHPGFHGDDAFAFRVFDGSLHSPPATVSITVRRANQAPVAESLSVSTTEETPVLLRLAAVDPDGDAVEFEILVPPEHGTLTGEATDLLYTPAAGFTGQDALVYLAFDGELYSEPATVSIAVERTNRPPVAEPQTLQTTHDVPLSIQLIGSDPDGDALSFELLSQPASGSLSGTPPDLMYTPTPGFTGEDAFAFRAFDGELYSEPAEIGIAVLRENLPPVIVSQPDIWAQVGQPYRYVLEASDPEGEPLALRVLEAPPGFEVLSDALGLGWIPDAALALDNPAPRWLCGAPPAQPALLGSRIRSRSPQAGYSASAPIVGAIADTNGDGIVDDRDARILVTVSPYNVLAATDVASGALLWQLDSPRVRGGSTAIYDLDGDGHPEVLAVSTGGELLAFDATGQIQLRSAPVQRLASPYYMELAVSSPDANGERMLAGGGVVWDSSGNLLWERSVMDGASLFVDLDLDGRDEVVMGTSAFDAEGRLLFNLPYPGSLALAQFGADLRPWIILTSATAGRLYAFDSMGAQRWSVDLRPLNVVGQPVLADIDSDGHPEIVVVTDLTGPAGAITVRAIRADGSPMWTTSLPPNEPYQTRIAPLVFDLTGDGVPEIVFQDHNTRFWLRGSDGALLLKALSDPEITPNTPLVVPPIDLDGDGAADLLQTHRRDGWVGLSAREGSMPWQPAPREWLQLHEGSWEPRAAGGRLLRAFHTRASLQTWRRSGLSLLGAELLPETRQLRAIVQNRGLRAAPGGQVNALIVQDGEWVEAAMVELPALEGHGRLSLAFDLPQALPSRIRLAVQSIDESCSDADRFDEFALVRLEVSDPRGASAEQAYYLNVLPSNRQPQFESTPPSRAQRHRQLSYRAAATDPDDGDEVRFELLEGPPGMGIHPFTGEVGPWTPDSATPSEVGIRIAVSDLQGARSEQAFTLSIDDLASGMAPIFQTQPPLEVPEREEYRYAAQATNPNDFPTPISFRLALSPPGAQVDATSGLLRWSPPGVVTAPTRGELAGCDAAVDLSPQSGTLSASGHLRLVVRNRGGLDAAAARISIEQAGADEPQVSAQVSVPARGMVAVPISLGQWLPDNGLLEVRVEAGPGSVDCVAENDRLSLAVFVLEALDEYRSVASQVFAVTVVDINDPPQFSLELPATAPVGRVLRGRALAQDPDRGDRVRLEARQLPAGAEFDPPSGQFLWTPGVADVGPHLLRFAAIDGSGLAVEVEHALSVVEPSGNGAPAFVTSPQPFSREGEGYSYASRALDPDPDDRISYRLNAAPAGASVDSASGHVLWPGAARRQAAATLSPRFRCHAGGTGEFDLRMRKLWSEGQGDAFPVVVGPLEDSNGNGVLDEGDERSVLILHGRWDGNWYIEARRGRDGSLQWRSETRPYVSAIALADADRDGEAEVYAMDREGYAFALDARGHLIWRSSEPGRQNAFNARVSVADVDGDGIAEILVGGLVVRADGHVLVNFDMPFEYMTAVDVALDGRIAIATDQGVFDLDGTQRLGFLGRLELVGGFDTDPYPEFLVLNGVEARVYKHDGSVLASFPVSGGGGAYGLADLDDDGQPEVFQAGRYSLSAYNPNRGMLWRRSSGYIEASGFTGATSFDFFGDGRRQVIHNDERFLRVLMGASGASLYEQRSGSYTQNEHVVVADIDGSGTASLIVYSDSKWAAFKPLSGSWPGTRGVWNQHEYDPGAINDDLTVPDLRFRTWSPANVLRSNPALPPTSLPDLALERVEVVGDSRRLRARVAIRNRSMAGAGVFDVAMVAEGTELATLRFDGISGGASQVREIEIDTPHPLPPALDVLVDPLGSVSECVTLNNGAELPLFDLRAADDSGAEAKQVFGVWIDDVPQPPRLLGAPAQQVGVGGQFEYQPEVIDPDVGDSHRFTLLSGPTSLQMHPYTGMLLWAPSVDDLGTHDIAIRVEDGHGLSDVQEFALEVIRAVQNRPPVVVSTPPPEVRAGETYSYTLLASDPDGDPVTWRLITAPEGTVLDRTGMLLWRPQVSSGQHYFLVDAVDPFGAAGSHAFYVRVRDSGVVNRAPSILSQAPTAAAVGLAFEYHVVATDPDGDALSYFIEHAPAGASIDSTSGAVRWMPAIHQIGTRNFTVGVSDGRGGTATQSFAVEVAPAAGSASPYFVSLPPQLAVVGYPMVYAVQALDPDGDALELQLLRAPAGAQLQGWQVDWTPALVDVGWAEFEIEVRDPHGNAARQWFYLPVSDRTINRAPVFQSLPPPGFAPGQAFVYRAQALDPDGDPVRYALLQAPEGAALDPHTGLLNWLPEDGDAGPWAFALIALDPLGAQAVQQFSVSYVLGNQPPQFLSHPPTQAGVGQGYVYDVVLHDPDGDTIELALQQAPAGAALVGARQLRWTPSANQVGAHDFVLEARDAEGATTLQEFAVWVTAPNRPPMIESAPPMLGRAGRPYAYGVQAIDRDGDALGYSLTQAPTGMLIDSSTGLIEWLPELDGSAAVTVRVSDGQAWAEQSWTISVLPASATLAVSLQLDPAIADEGQAVSVSVVPEHAIAPLQIDLRLDGVPLAVDAELRSSFVAGTPGSYPLTVTIEDGVESASAQATLIVRDPNAAAPQVRLIEPALHPDYDALEVTAPTPIVAEAEGDVASWLLALRARGESGHRVLAQGTGAFAAEELAVFDPTRLTNGLYELILQARGANGETVSDSRVLRVTGDMKLGHFSIAFEEVSIPLAGIPVTVTRGYDTRRAHQSLDFGHGWTVDAGAIRLQESRTPGFGWSLLQYGGPLGNWCVQPNGSPIVTVTLPDGQVESFRARAEPECSQLAQPYVQLVFEPLAGTHSQLESTDLPLLRLLDGRLIDPDQPDRAADPRLYRLTTAEGLVFDIDQNLGLTRLTEPASGQHLSFTRDGVLHSTGVGIAFVRDGAGRIVRMVLPDATEITYAYTAAGDLAAVTDQVGNVTRFAYVTDPRWPHYLQDIIDPRGVRVARNEYDDSGRLVATIDADGRRIEFDHDVVGRLQRIKDRNGNESVYLFDERGRVLSETNALGETVSRTYNEWGHELSRTDGLGRTTSWTYDARGNALTETNPLGQTTTSAYNAQNQLMSQHDAAGRLVMSNAYDGRTGIQLTQAVDALGNVTAFGYDPSGSLTSLTDAAGAVTRFEYNPYTGFKIAEVDAMGRRTEFVNDSMGRVLSETRRRSRPDGTQEILVIRYRYDDKGRLVETEYPDGSLSSTEYGPNDQPTRECDALARCTVTECNARGEVERVSYPDGSTETRDYDANGNLVAQTDRMGRVTRMVYDAANRLIETIHPDATPGTDADNPRSRQRYNAAGELVESEDELGRVTQYRYDATGRQTHVIHPHPETGAAGQGAVLETVYDIAGRRVASIDPMGAITRYVYDDAGRLIETIHPDPGSDDGDDSNNPRTRVQLDAAGRKIADIDEAGRITRYAFDALGRLVAVVLPNPVTGANPELVGGNSPDPGTLVTRYVYDEAGNKTQQIDAEGRITRFEYDSQGRETARVLPEGQRETKTYTEAGELDTHTDFNGQTTVYRYGDAGQLDRIEYPTDPEVRFEHNAAGERERVIDGRGSSHSQYDARGRLIRSEDADGGLIEYEYDAAGNLLARISPSQSLVYGYDAQNRLQTVTRTVDGEAPTTTRYEYDGNGRRSVMVGGDGTRTEYAFDRRNRLTGLLKRSAAGVLLLGMGYTVDATGMRTGIEEFDVAGITRTVAYQYDPVKRLVSETIDHRDDVHDRHSEWAYDRVGNRLIQVVVSGEGDLSPLQSKSVRGEEASRRPKGANEMPSRTTHYTYDANDRLLTETTDGAVTVYTYDANGNTLSKTGPDGSVSYTYNDANRLIQASNAEGITSYVYNADGLRVRQTHAPTLGQPVTTWYVQDSNYAYAQVIEAYESVGAGPKRLTATYTFADDLVSQTRYDEAGNPSTSFVQMDGFGSTRWLTDSTGAITDEVDYDAFGNTVRRSGSTEVEHLYRGERFDALLDAYDLRARLYMPGNGRFLTQDTFAGYALAPQSLHKYTYGHADPVSNTDPSGQMIVGVFMDLVLSSIIERSLQNTRFVTGTAQAYRGYAALRRITFGTYKDLRALQQSGKGIWQGSRQAGDEVHHLVEKRFLNSNYNLSPRLRSYLSKEDDIVSVALKHDEHKIFTKRWAEELGRKGMGTYRRDLDVDDIVEAARRVYRDSPELFRAVQMQFL